VDTAAEIADEDITRMVAARRRQGLSLSAAARDVAAEIGRPRSEVYEVARRSPVTEADEAT
jgi:hypothetical protein